MKIAIHHALAAALLASMVGGGAGFGQTAPPSGNPSLGAKPQQLLFVELKVHSFAATRGFYVDLLGMKEIPGPTVSGPPTSGSFSFSGARDDSYLEFTQAKDKEDIAHAGVARLIVKVHDIAAVFARAHKAGAQIVREPTSAHGVATLLVGLLNDPDGYTVEVVQNGG